MRIPRSRHLTANFKSNLNSLRNFNLERHYTRLIKVAVINLPLIDLLNKFLIFVLAFFNRTNIEYVYVYMRRWAERRYLEARGPSAALFPFSAPFLWELQRRSFFQERYRGFCQTSAAAPL